MIANHGHGCGVSEVGTVQSALIGITGRVRERGAAGSSHAMRLTVVHGRFTGHNIIPVVNGVLTFTSLAGARPTRPVRGWATYAHTTYIDPACAPQLTAPPYRYSGKWKCICYLLIVEKNGRRKVGFHGDEEEKERKPNYEVRNVNAYTHAHSPSAVDPDGSEPAAMAKSPSRM